MIKVLVGFLALLPSIAHAYDQQERERAVAVTAAVFAAQMICGDQIREIDTNVLLSFSLERGVDPIDIKEGGRYFPLVQMSVKTVYDDVKSLPPEKRCPALASRYPIWIKLRDR